MKTGFVSTALSMPVLLGALSLMLCAGSVHAGALAPTSSTLSGDAMLTPPQAKEWSFSMQPYGWLASISGDIGLGGFEPVAVDVPFVDTLKRLDMVAALQADLRYGKWSLLLDGMYLKVSDSVDTPGRLLSAIDVEMEQILFEAAIGYRIWESERGYVDLLAGFRYMEMRSRLDFTVSPAGVRAVSEDISDRVVDQAVNATQKAVKSASGKLKGQLAVLAPATRAELQAKADGIRSNVRQEVIERVLKDNSIVEIIEKIRDLTPAQIEKIREAKELAQAQKELVRALLDQEIAAKLSNAKAQVASAVTSAKKKAAQAVAQARKKLAKQIEKTIRETIPDSAAGSKGWVDPFVGLRAKYMLTDRLYFAARCDVGGFGVSSKLAWQAFGALGWQFDKHWSAELGYRYLSVDYEDGGFVYDTQTSGAFLGLKYVF